jgi:hemerythrin-like metal-binding protein
MLSTGLGELDTQHKKLIDLVNQFNDVMQSGKGADSVGSLFTELRNLFEFHFDHEEELMAQYGYLKAPEHKAEHTKFIQIADDLKRKFDAEITVETVEILNLLHDWLTSHAMKTDKELGQTLSQF